MRVVLMLLALCATLSARAESVVVVAPTVWGEEWVAGGYLQHDLRLSERVGVALAWRPDADLGALSLTYRTSDWGADDGQRASTEEPLTLRFTLRGWALFEGNSEQGMDVLSLSRVDDRDIRRQLWMISLSKRF